MKVWENYIKKLFSDTREEIEIGDINSGQDINMIEIEKAISLSKKRKATGPDDIPIEIIKLMEREGKEKLVKLFNDIYNSGKIPEDWLKSTFVTIPKKTQCQTLQRLQNN